MTNQKTNYRRRILLKAASGTAFSVSLAGCTGDDTDESESTDGSTMEDENESTDGSTVEPESFPDGLSEGGANLGVLRAAVDMVINGDSFLSHSEYVTEENDADARTIGGDPEADRGKEIGVRNNPDPIHDVVDENGIEKANARTENLLSSDSWFFSFYNDGASYINGQSREPEMRREDTFQNFVVETASDYADEIFETLAEFNYGVPEWDSDLGLYILPASYEDDEEIVVHHGGLWVTADGLPVFAGGHLSANGNSIDAFVMLQPEDVTIELPDWVDEANEN